MTSAKKLDQARSQKLNKGENKGENKSDHEGHYDIDGVSLDPQAGVMVGSAKKPTSPQDQTKTKNSKTKENLKKTKKLK